MLLFIIILKQVGQTQIYCLLGIRLLPKLSQEMVEQANYRRGNIIHFETYLQGTFQSS